MFKRSDSRWHCRGSIKGEQHRTTTGCKDEKAADKIAEEGGTSNYWAQTAPGPSNKPSEKTFKQAADVFVDEYKASVEGQRNPRWTRSHGDRLRLLSCSVLRR